MFVLECVYTTLWSDDNFLFQGCDYVIALTHMRTPNDIKLAENVNEIDLILGGHDHVYEVQRVCDDVLFFVICVLR